MAKYCRLGLILVVGVGLAGCVTFCDDCDDFPSPGGPGGYSLLPGSYTGPPPSQAADAPPVSSPSQNRAPSSEIPAASPMTGSNSSSPASLPPSMNTSSPVQ